MDIFTGLWMVIKEILGSIKVIVVIEEWEEAVQLRMGRFRRIRKPGWWFHRPFGIDEFYTFNVKPSAMELDEQALVTRDGHEIVVKGVLMWSIFDIRKAVCDVENAPDTLGDIALGIIQETVQVEDWDYLRTEACRKDIKKRIQRQARKWGISVSSFKWQSIVQARTFKLFGSM